MKPTGTKFRSFPSRLDRCLNLCSDYFALSPSSLSAPAMDSQHTGVNAVNDIAANDVSSATVPSHDRDPEPSIRGNSLEPAEEIPPTSLENPTTSVSRLQEGRPSQSPPSQPTTPPPPRATLVLPDEMTLNDQADFSRAAGPREAGHTSPKTPGTPPSDGQNRYACGGQSIGASSAISSPGSEGGCRDGAAPLEKRQPESRPGSGIRRSSPSAVRTRTPRVLKTSRDFAHTIRRVYKVSAAAPVSICRGNSRE